MKVCSSCQRCYDNAVVSCAESEHPELSDIREGMTDMVAGYRLEILLGSGLKDQTYRARRLDSDQPCLVRIVSANEEYKERFLRDAQTATMLFNQSIVDIYEANSLDNGEVFVVAEEPAGQTVRELLNNVGVPQLLTTIQVVRQAAEAVHALHVGGLVHRSIRPENIILTTDAEHRLLVRIQNCDLGGVIEHSIVSNKFLIDSALDTLRYFAPEQFSGGTTIKADIYGLGIVLYEMLAGTPPFDSDKASGLIDMHRNQRPPDVIIDNFDLRMLLMHTLMESLQKAPEKRQSSANAFARQLRHMEQLALHSPTPPPASVGAAVPQPVNSVGTGAAAAAAKRAPVANMVPEPKLRETLQTAPQLVIAAKPEMISDKPIPQPDAELDPIPVRSSPVLKDLASIPDPQIDREVEAEVAFADIVAEEPIPATKRAAPEISKSRLKRMKRQLRTFTTPATDAASTKPCHVIEIEQKEGSAIPVMMPPKVELGQPENGDASLNGDHSREIKSEIQAPEMTVAATNVLIASAAARALPVVELTQPEEDLPSLDDIPEALFAEAMPAASMVEESQVAVSSRPVSDAPIQVEFVQAAKDIPSVQEVAQPLLIKPVATSAIVPEPQISSAVSDAPRKIVWEQPEDDIPSIEDVTGAHLTEITPPPIVSDTQVRVSRAPALNVPRKIEWEQPEDIPSLEDVPAALLLEPPAEHLSVEATTSSVAIPTGPRKVEWEQPEDIPTLEDVSEALQVEPLAEHPTIPEPQVMIATTTVSARPRKVEWQQPEDDIPSMEDVVQVLSEESMVEAVFVPTPEETPVTVLSTPRKIDWIQPEDDIPSLEEAMEVLATDGPISPAISEPVPEAVPVIDTNTEMGANANMLSVVMPVSSVTYTQTEIAPVEPEPGVTTPNIVPVVTPEPVNAPPTNVISGVESEPEEITLVSPPTRIKIDWEKPPPWEPTATRLSKEIEFFPTLLGDVDKKGTADHSDHFFSDYDDDTSHASDHHRSLMIGSGFIALIALFLFGNDSFRGFFQSAAPPESASIRTTTAKQTLPQSEQPMTPYVPPMSKTIEKPVSGEDLYAGQLKSSPIKASSPISDQPIAPPSVTSGRHDKLPQAQTGTRKAGKSPLVPSTLVISSDDGKVSTKVEPEKRPADKKARSGQNAPAGSTRPRIVANPQR